jgi:HK97 gp10 family phage protein
VAGRDIQVYVKIEGAKELLEELQRLGGNVRSTARSAVRAGARVIQAQAEQNAEAIGGYVAKRTALRITQRKKGLIEAAIGPSKKKWYYRFIEVGTQPHEIKGNPLVFEGDRGLVIIGGVQHPGMAARPWLRPAFDTKKDASTQAVGDFIRRAVEERRAIVEHGADDED